MKKRLGPQNRLYPAPAPLVLSGLGDEASMLAVAWITIVGSKPPAIGMALGKRHHTLELIRQCEEFTVNVPTTDMAVQVDYCGIVSGRDRDKVMESGLTLTPSAVVGPPIIQECPYNLECRVLQELDLPTGNVFVIGEIVETHADENVLNADGKTTDMGKLDPLIYITGNREYYRLGDKIADAYGIGRALKRD